MSHSLYERVITLKEVEEAIEEKMADHEEWFKRGIITKRELDDAQITLESIKGRLFSKSRAPKKEIA